MRASEEAIFMLRNGASAASTASFAHSLALLIGANPIAPIRSACKLWLPTRDAGGTAEEGVAPGKAIPARFLPPSPSPPGPPHLIGIHPPPGYLGILGGFIFPVFTSLNFLSISFSPTVSRGGASVVRFFAFCPCPQLLALILAARQESPASSRCSGLFGVCHLQGNHDHQPTTPFSPSLLCRILYSPLH